MSLAACAGFTLLTSLHAQQIQFVPYPRHGISQTKVLPLTSLLLQFALFNSHFRISRCIDIYKISKAILGKRNGSHADSGNPYRTSRMFQHTCFVSFALFMQSEMSLTEYDVNREFRIPISSASHVIDVGRPAS